MNVSISFSNFCEKKINNDRNIPAIRQDARFVGLLVKELTGKQHVNENIRFRAVFKMSLIKLMTTSNEPMKSRSK